jgi:hypothetical protein
VTDAQLRPDHDARLTEARAAIPEGDNAQVERPVVVLDVGYGPPVRRPGRIRLIGLGRRDLPRLAVAVDRCDPDPTDETQTPRLPSCDQCGASVPPIERIASS